MKMKKIILTAVFSIVLIVPILFAISVYAQNTYEYTVLAPLPGTTKADSLKTDLPTYLSGIFNLAIGLSAAFAVFMIVLGGFQYMSTDALQKKQDGKQRIQNAVYGLFLVIGAWLILYTINPNLLKLNLNIEPVSVAPTTAPGTLTQPGTPMTAEQIADSNAVRASLAAKDVLAYMGPCERGQLTGCVNLNGLTDVTKNGLVSLRNDFKSTIKITGGTESGHSTTGDHPAGNAVDFSFQQNPNLGTFVEKNKIGNPVQTTLGPRYTLKINGKDVTFLKEDDHWHVVFK